MVLYPDLDVLTSLGLAFVCGLREAGAGGVSVSPSQQIEGICGEPFSTRVDLIGWLINPSTDRTISID